MRTKHNFDYRGVDECRWFAEQMIEKLNTPKNQIKPAWDTQRIDRLLDALKGEVKELENEINRNKQITDIDAIVSECCDVANYAMMIADNLKITKFKVRNA